MVVDAITIRHNLLRIVKSLDPALLCNYLVFDTETTSPSPREGYIWQLGLYPVYNCEPQFPPTGKTIYLRLPDDKLRLAEYEISRRRAVRLGYPTPKANFVKDAAYCEEEERFIEEVRVNGIDPQEAYEAFICVLKLYQDNGWPLAGHNVITFDIPFINKARGKFGGDFDFLKGTIIDTGMLVKAGLLCRRIAVTESTLSFYTRVREERASGVYWSLDNFCVPYWNLDGRYGFDVKKAHAAGFDCYMTSLVLAELFEIARMAENVIGAGY